MKNKKVRVLTGTAMLTAIGVILQYMEISIPFVPDFIKLDFSDLAELVGAIAFGPVAGVVICFLRNLIHMAASSSAFVGELSNFILGAVFALTAGLIYKKNKTFKGAVLGGVIGALVMAVFSLASNYFLIYPLYYSVLGFPEEAILGAYQLILPKTKNMLQALLIFNVPFTFVKGLICAAVMTIIYKPLASVLKNNKNS